MVGDAPPAEPDFLWMYTEEPHRSRRMAILKAHPEVSGYTVLCGMAWVTTRPGEADGSCILHLASGILDPRSNIYDVVAGGSAWRSDPIA
jgi:hypothetical protein